MKRIIAALLAALMLMTAAAVAEEEAANTTLIMSIENIEVLTIDDSGPRTVALEGAGVYAAIGATGDGIALVGEADEGDEALALAVVKLIDNSLRFTMGGLDKTYAVDLSAQLQGQGLSAVQSLLPLFLPALVNLELPQAPGIPIPKLDLSGVLASFATETAGDHMSFEIPAELVSALLEQLVSAAGSANAQAGALLGQVVTGDGVSASLSGTITDDGASQTIVADVYPVIGGAASEEAAATLTLVSRENDAILAVDVSMGEYGAMTVAQVELASDPDAPTIDFTVNVMDTFGVGLSAFVEDGLQHLRFDLAGGGLIEDVAADYCYGKLDGADLNDFSVQVGNRITVIRLVTELLADAYREGTLTVSDQQGGKLVQVEGDVVIGMGDADLSELVLPETIVNISQIDPSEVEAAVQPLAEYLSGALATVASPAA